MICLQIILLFGLLESCLMITNREELLRQDPSLWPGHLEPIGSQQPTGSIEELHEWPEPETFFREYVDKNKPALFKGLAKLSPGYEKFNDDYFKNAIDADKTIIYAEPELKENRTKQGFEISMKEFIERYHKETLYMVNMLPAQYTPDVRMPAPLRCESTRDLMSSQVTWFSTGGTKSVLHNDDVDNINCLFRGSKVLWFIEYTKNKNFVPIDMVQGGYSSMDVDKVNYTKFPEFRKVDMYYKAVMEQGDCLFIPYHWFHQVNSKANEDKMNLAVNVWFKHKIGHKPTGCDIPVSEATLDKYRFPDDEAEQKGKQSYVEYFSQYIPKGKYLNFEIFSKLLLRDPTMNPDRFDMEPSEIAGASKDLFEKLDIDKNGKLSKKDFKKIDALDDSALALLEDELNKLVANVENAIEDKIEDTQQEELAKVGGDAGSDADGDADSGVDGADAADADEFGKGSVSAADDDEDLTDGKVTKDEL